MSPQDVQKIGFEIATLGTNGFDVNDYGTEVPVTKPARAFTAASTWSA